MSHNSNNMNGPRQPSAAKPFKAPSVAPQDLPVDYSGFIAVVFGIAESCFGTSLATAWDHIQRPITGEYEERRD